MDKQQIRETIARRAARELKDGDVVNLGIGIPTLIPNYLDKDVKIMIHSENGILGMGAKPVPGEEDAEVTDAGGAFTTVNDGGALFDSATSFGYIRGGHVDATVLGALQTDVCGNLANWSIPGKKTPGMGGAMDLVSSAKRVILAMEHTANGKPKIVEACTLPLTGAKVVDLIITEMGVIEVTPEGLTLVEYNPEFTVEDIQAATAAPLIVSPNLKPMF